MSLADHLRIWIQFRTVVPDIDILPNNSVGTTVITYIQYYAAVVDDVITFNQILHKSVSAIRILPGEHVCIDAEN
jgi:hypothetical protein